MTDKITDKKKKQKKCEKGPGYFRRFTGAVALLTLVFALYILYAHYKETGRLFDFQNLSDQKRIIRQSVKESRRFMKKVKHVSEKAAVRFNDAIDVSSEIGRAHV